MAEQRRTTRGASLAEPPAADLSAASASVPGLAPPDTIRGSVPASDFPSVQGLTYLNSALKHPFSIHVARALTEYAETNLRVADGGQTGTGVADGEVLAGFARLINADPFEVSFVPSTMAAENLILADLGIPGTPGNIVTDDLHYVGSLYLYHRLAEAGVEVRQVRQQGGAIAADDLLQAIDRNTKLVAVSQVSSANGFEHELRPICEAAHAKGALVYADIIQAVGATPVDVKASGVDLCAASTHKWLMGDKGLGFIYVRRDLLETGQIKGVQHGWKQNAGEGLRIFDDRERLQAGPPGAYQVRPGAIGAFEVGTYALGPMMAARASLGYIERLGVVNIRAHAASLATRVRTALPRLGYPCLSPRGAAPYISTFQVVDRATTQAKLHHARIQVKFAQNLVRVSTSVLAQ